MSEQPHCLTRFFGSRLPLKGSGHWGLAMFSGPGISGFGFKSCGLLSVQGLGVSGLGGLGVDWGGLGFGILLCPGSMTVCAQAGRWPGWAPSPSRCSSSTDLWGRCAESALIPTCALKSLARKTVPWEFEMLSTVGEERK